MKPLALAAMLCGLAFVGSPAIAATDWWRLVVNDHAGRPLDAPFCDQAVNFSPLQALRGMRLDPEARIDDMGDEVDVVLSGNISMKFFRSEQDCHIGQQILIEQINKYR